MQLGCFFNNLFTLTKKKYQSSALLAFVKGTHWLPVDSPLKGPVMWKVFLCHAFFLKNSCTQSVFRHVVSMTSCTVGTDDVLFMQASCLSQHVYSTVGKLSLYGDGLTHWGWDKMDAISQTTCSGAFSWMKIFEFRLKFHWSLFLRVQLTIIQHCFR